MTDFQQALYYQKQKQFEQAKQCFKRALEMEGPHAELLLHIGKHFYLTGNYKRALDYYVASAHQAVCEDERSCDEQEKIYDELPIYAQLDLQSSIAVILIEDRRYIINTAYALIAHLNELENNTSRSNYEVAYYAQLLDDGSLTYTLLSKGLNQEKLDYFHDGLALEVGLDYLVKNIQWNKLDDIDVLDYYVHTS